MKDRERYGAVLRAPHVASLLALAVIARASIGINGLAIVLVVREATGSYAAAGGSAAALVAGVAISAPVIGRIVDRLGASRLLLALAVVQAAALLAIAALARADAPSAVIGLTAFAAGCAQPPIGSVLRTLWADLIDSRLLTTAFALDSISVELAFVAGPLIVAVAAAFDEPRVALVIAACATLGGTAAFTTSEPVRRRVPSRGAGSSGGRLGALRSHGVLTIVLSVVPVGFCLGAAEVAFPAFGEAVGSRALAGPLIALWSVGSFFGGLVYGARGHRLRPARAFEWGVIALPLVTLPLAAPSSFAAMVPLALLAGVAVAPMLAAANQVIGDVAPRGALTEAYTWLSTAIVAGVTVGNASSGAIIELRDWRAAFVAAAVVGAAGFLVVAARRETLEPVEPAASACQP